MPSGDWGVLVRGSHTCLFSSILFLNTCPNNVHLCFFMELLILSIPAVSPRLPRSEPSVASELTRFFVFQVYICMECILKLGKRERKIINPPPLNRQNTRTNIHNEVKNNSLNYQRIQSFSLIVYPEGHHIFKWSYLDQSDCRYVRTYLRMMSQTNTYSRHAFHVLTNFIYMYKNEQHTIRS
jgi:hypothetical protein